MKKVSENMDPTSATAKPRQPACDKVYVIPLLVCFLVPITFIMTYFSAVLNGHVKPVLPYISQTGALPPESCIFSQYMNIAAATMLVCNYIKYRQVHEFSRLFPSRAISQRANIIAAVLGTLSSIGLDIIANFQDINHKNVHRIGAMLLFLPGIANFCMQTSFSRNMCPDVCSRRVFTIRRSLCVAMLVLDVVCLVCAVTANRWFTGPSMMLWSPHDGGYEFHVISAGAEWLNVIIFCAFSLTYVREFKHIVIQSPVFRLTNVEAEFPSMKFKEGRRLSF